MEPCIRGFKAVQKCCSAVFVFIYKKPTNQLLKITVIILSVHQHYPLVNLLPYLSFLFRLVKLFLTGATLSAPKAYTAFLACLTENDKGNKTTRSPKATPGQHQTLKIAQVTQEGKNLAVIQKQTE